MKLLPYAFFGGAAVVALVVAVVYGGWFWLLPAIMVPIALVYLLVVDRRLRRDESQAQRLSSEIDPDR